MGKIVDLTGRKFGKLTVNYKDTENHIGANHTYWICTCECTRETCVRASHLVSGNVKSCGVCVKSNLVGMKFGKLTVLEKIDDRHDGNQIWWRCICDCVDKNIVEVPTRLLRYENTTSCGCINKPNLVGEKFGKLTVVREDASHDQGRFWVCRCEEGNEVVVSTGRLMSGNTKSCGCLKKFEEGASSCNKLFQRYQYEAKIRNLEFELDKLYFLELTKQECFYCGSIPSNNISGRGFHGSYTYNGVDRIDNEKGYILGNVVPCCLTCNSMKWKLSQSEFLDKIYLIVNFFGKKSFIIKEFPFDKDYKSAFNNLWSRYVAGAKRRNISFNIDKNQFWNLTHNNCYYCGESPSFFIASAHKKMKDYVYNGVDRIDNNIGYEIDNVVPCCGTCNKMKHANDLDFFLSHIQKILTHMQNK